MTFELVLPGFAAGILSTMAVIFIAGGRDYGSLTRRGMWLCLAATCVSTVLFLLFLAGAISLADLMPITGAILEADA